MMFRNRSDHRPLSALPWLAVLFAGVLAGQEKPAWVYVSAFQSGKVDIFRLSDGKAIRSIPVDDGAGITGLAVSRDGKKLFIVDGARNHQLRIFDTRTGKQTSAHPVGSRLLSLGGAPVIHLSADDRWLFVKTYDYAAAAAGVRIFDVVRGDFRQAGLRNRACEAPLLASAPGVLFLACPGWIQEMRAGAAAGDFESVRKVPMPLTDLADIAVSASGQEIYVLEAGRPEGNLSLVQWTRGRPAVDAHRQVLRPGEQGRQAWIAAGGDSIGVVHHSRAWLLSRNGGEVRRTAELPAAATGVSFAAGDHDLLTLVGASGSLVRISAATGKLQSMKLDGLSPSAKPWVWRTAPSPE